MLNKLKNNSNNKDDGDNSDNDGNYYHKTLPIFVFTSLLILLPATSLPIHLPVYLFVYYLLVRPDLIR